MHAIDHSILVMMYVTSDESRINWMDIGYVIETIPNKLIPIFETSILNFYI